MIKILTKLLTKMPKICLYLLSKELTILIGENDNDPNDSGLRRNSIVDQQGVNRFTRANYFYNLALKTKL